MKLCELDTYSSLQGMSLYGSGPVCAPMAFIEELDLKWASSPLRCADK